MRPQISHSNRWYTVAQMPPAARAERHLRFADAARVAADFVTTAAPSTPHDDTRWVMLRDGETLHLGICCFDSLAHLSGGAPSTDELEVLFDRRHDHVGFEQYIFNPPAPADTGASRDQPTADAAATAHHERPDARACMVHIHAPYDETLHSAWQPPTAPRFEWEDASLTACTITRDRCRWLWVQWPVSWVFEYGNTVGFNIFRNRPIVSEMSSWSYCGGNGSPDATAFGHLYLETTPVAISRVRAVSGEQALQVAGQVAGLPPGATTLTLTVADPLDRRQTAEAVVADGDWRLEVPLASPPTPGRWRFYPQVDGRPVEPEYLALDIAAAAPQFVFSVLYDTPMCLINAPYTPERLDREMAHWAGAGLQRIHWLDYGPWPSFWETPLHQWQPNVAATEAACGDLLPATRAAAHRQGLEFIGDFKTFDLGFNCWFQEPDGVSTVADIEGRHMPVIPEIAAHPEATQQANTLWHPAPAAAPIATLHLYSDAPIPATDVDALALMVSDDNRAYRPYDGPLSVQVEAVERPALVWTPAGTRPDTTAAPAHCWRLTISHLRLDAPFLAVCVADASWHYESRGFLVAEALTAAGDAVATTVATNGDAASGFFFWKGWPGWNNVTEALLQPRRWPATALGLAVGESTSLPTLLEPCSPVTRRIWLDRVTRILDGGADGVSIRTYCHHNGVMHYLKYAYSADVRADFQSRYGREPSADPADYPLLRQVRAAAYTTFIREASALCRARGKRFMVLLESGAEVPDSLHVRMQLPLAWRTWLEERLIDELRLKFWTAESRWIHQEVLPVARRVGVPVSLISRCLHTGVELRTREFAALTAGRAAAAGFAGYTLYEQQNLQGLDPLGQPFFKGPVATWLAAARAALYPNQHEGKI